MINICKIKTNRHGQKRSEEHMQYVYRSMLWSSIHKLCQFNNVIIYHGTVMPFKIQNQKLVDKFLQCAGLVKNKTLNTKLTQLPQNHHMNT